MSRVEVVKVAPSSSLPAEQGWKLVKELRSCKIYARVISSNSMDDLADLFGSSLALGVSAQPVSSEQEASAVVEAAIAGATAEDDALASLFGKMNMRGGLRGKKKTRKQKKLSRKNSNKK